MVLVAIGAASTSATVNVVPMVGSRRYRISVERGRFNDAAKDYNTAVRRFPAVLFAGMFGFHPKPYFQADAGSEKAPEVKFDFGGKP